MTSRRQFLVTAVGLKVSAILTRVTRAGSPGQARRDTQMYGLIGRMSAVAGRRDELLAILLKSVGDMPGCLSYVVATDPGAPDAVWITEVWDSEASHKASLSLPAVRRDQQSQATRRRVRPALRHHASRWSRVTGKTRSIGGGRRALGSSPCLVSRSGNATALFWRAARMPRPADPSRSAPSLHREPPSGRSVSARRSL